MKTLLTLALAAPLAGVEVLAESLQMEALAPANSGDGGTLFTRLTPEETGITHLNSMDVDHPMSYLYHSGMTCGGVAVADFDGDGRPDLFFAGSTGPNHLYLQTGKLKFVDVTAKAGAGLDGGNAWSAGATAVDINADGRMDLYVGNYMQPNQLFLNMGKGPDGEAVVFKECAKEAGLDVVDCTHSSAFADYDGDGKLDVYILTNRIEDPDGSPAELPIVPGTIGTNSLPKVLPEKEKMYAAWRWDTNNWGVEAIGSPDFLFRQTGTTADGVPTFEDVTAKAGIYGHGDGLSVTWWDPDGDGDPDLYIGNDFIEPDRWYENNGDGTFSNKLRERVAHTPWFSMGADFGDVNGDGLLDLLVADMSATSHFKSKTTMGIMGGIPLQRSFHGKPQQLMRNALYLSNGTDRYEEGAYSFKVSSTDWTWSVKLADYDLDGWQDVYFTNGISRHMNDSDFKITADMLVGKHMFEFWKDGEMRKELNRCYQNSHGEKFVETSEDWGLGHLGVSYGSALGDLDGDGDPELITVNLEEPDAIYLNGAKNPNRIAVELREAGGNSRALNSTVEVVTAHGTQIRHLSPSSGYLSCNEPVLLFGLGDDEVVKELRVHWAHGGVQSFANLKAGQRYLITRDAEQEKPATGAPATPLFAEDSSLGATLHEDEGWESDFNRPRQSLLPWSFSQLGPTLACADIDGDGDTDFYLGGTAGSLGQLRVNDGKGGYPAKWVDAFAEDQKCEDAAALFLDVDQDGDADLFVAGGSNEFEPDSELNRDRLYLNDGKGGFTAAPEGSLPADTLIGSCSTAADFDRDGDIDLFVGTRLKAWSYPRSEPSRLLVNEGGKFVEASAEMMPGRDTLGLVTGAVAADLDGDGWIDLTVATEWGPVRWFRNENGKLVDASESAGLAGITGFWNSVTTADFDQDGDLDLVAGNIGLNTKYKQPSSEKPHLAYIGDFDGEGEQFVEVKREGDCLYPERGRSCSSNAMPFIKEKFGTFKSFALASLEDIYEEDKLEQADQLAITEFQSGIFVNEGGKFRFEPLPRAAQLAPVFGMSTIDATGDGHPDLLLSGNFLRGPQIETGAFDGGVGVILKGDGKGGLTPLPAGESGVLLTGDHRALVQTDLNNDSRPDFLAAANNGPMHALRNEAGGRWLAVRLPSTKCAGATVTLKRSGQPDQLVAVTCGSGYWSQNDTVAWFGLGDSEAGGQLEIRWPDGALENRDWNGNDLSVNVTAK